jgi:hypothetical protein
MSSGGLILLVLDRDCDRLTTEWLDDYNEPDHLAVGA